MVRIMSILNAPRGTVAAPSAHVSVDSGATLNIGNRDSQPASESRTNTSRVVNMTDRIEALNFENSFGTQGAVGGVGSRSPRESLVEAEALTLEERHEVSRLLADMSLNPFLKDKNVQDRSSMYINQFGSHSNLGLIDHAAGGGKQTDQFRGTVNTPRRSTSSDQIKIPRPTLRFSSQTPAPPVNVAQNYTRKTVPIHQWNISFSGDGKGPHLYDFFEQVALFQRSEGVSNEDMVSSIVHLLSGRAKLWFMTVNDYVHTWDQLVFAMKREFLARQLRISVGDRHNQSRAKARRVVCGIHLPHAGIVQMLVCTTGRKP